MNSKNSSESRNISPGQAFFEKMCNPQILRKNLKKAIEESWMLGIPVTQQDENGIYDLYPDGTKKYIDIKDIENS
ncbi:hypothetical protein [Succinivibrio faecicola]|uniref:Uncharacterized protein n=1 Tax=Succinivibrio faecicola TaxID=2820300 RepID=A0ABS7DIC1_9GAMM|nr:hypothetical protein [Succinivibrio faecicola]MBW7570286.1 hypothetical protein [Succinivibrio faecicola]